MDMRDFTKESSCYCICLRQFSWMPYGPLVLLLLFPLRALLLFPLIVMPLDGEEHTCAEHEDFKRSEDYRDPIHFEYSRFPNEQFLMIFISLPYCWIFSGQGMAGSGASVLCHFFVLMSAVCFLLLFIILLFVYIVRLLEFTYKN